MLATSLRKLTAFRVVTAAFTAMDAPASIMAQYKHIRADGSFDVKTF